MGHYRPRPSETRNCQHCGQGFLSGHKRTRYCGESCRQLAYKARRKSLQPPSAVDSPPGQLRFSLQNMGITTAGPALVATANYVLNDRPSQQALLAQLAQLSQRVDQLTKAIQASGIPLPTDLPPVSSTNSGERADSHRVVDPKPMTLDELADQIVRKNR